MLKVFHIPHEELLKHVAELRTLEETANKFGCDPVTVHTALKKAGLKSRGRFKDSPPKCFKCGEDDPEKFNRRAGHRYKNHPTGVWMAWCIGCQSAHTRNYKRKNRQRILDVLGGKCLLCAFSQYPSALDVHHLDPAKKHISAGNMAGWKWERIEKEIVDCVLLCSNCHRGHHNGELSTEASATLTEAFKHRGQPYTTHSASQHKILNNKLTISA